MSYVHGIIQNGEAAMIAADDMVIEFRDGCMTVTVDGKSSQTRVWSKDTQRFYEIMKEFFDGRSEGKNTSDVG